MPAHLDFVRNNERYAENFDQDQQGQLAIPPAKHCVIVTCMDARLDPAAHLGIQLGDAHVIRNAGGCARDAVRSIVISQRLLGTKEIAVFHHTGCGMLLFNTPQLRSIVKDAQPGDTEVAGAVDKIDFLEFDTLEGSVKSDVDFLQKHPLILKETVVTGWVYDVKTGKVTQVA